MSKQKWRTVVSYLFSFFLAFFLFVIVILTTTRFTLMSSSYFMNKMDAVDYYDNTATELNRFIKNNAAPSGFPLEMFENYIKEEDIRDEMIRYEENMFEGKHTVVSVDEIRKRIVKDTDKYIIDNNIVLNPSTRLGVEDFINTIVNQYTYLTQFPYINEYVSIINLFEKVYMLSIPVLLIVSALLCLAIYKLYDSKRRRKKYYSYALIGSGLLIGTLPFYLYAVRFFERINLSPKYMYDLLVALTRTYLFVNIMVGICFILFGFMVTYLKLKPKRKKGERSRTSQELEMISNFEQENN
ncbi:MAG: hypothetical protein RR443_09585 [Anaerorhabdus sp.]|uniref:hypothetical protein n=1 Tax=Anaerorhabdus sp. TaxID=1872524 RepID=UPI002FC74AAC